ncbi:hypothetical protein P872_14395 [Rhodonellum psychrophilum GCM71 = DSM 17998]|uniref:GxxExxY protein n=2 Tax=Rhodonellum TaxID=336827 RepID=U5BU85_9BACT|nr:MULTISPECIES: GxxExxY protein [Rhodonellum]ERM80151.1 hypothetical protein P872_14395 [Rhodonellum psychrophilum GCM71 = DSM 17998]SDZ57649.1 GxxExxY protein [Rhodonellum ikkaensis]
MTENDISFEIVTAAINLHKNLGPGLLESVYEHALAYDLRKLGLNVHQQKPMPFYYQDVVLDVGYKLDLLVEGKVLIEVKSVSEISKIHKAQILTYLRLSKLKLGLLINFNVVMLKDGLHRYANNL